MVMMFDRMNEKAAGMAQVTCKYSLSLKKSVVNQPFLWRQPDDAFTKYLNLAHIL